MKNIIAASALFLAAPALSETVMHTAAGTFEVKITVLPADPARASKTGRMAVAKTYAGDLAGTASGEMQTAGPVATGSGAYVMIEQVDGTLGGRQGSFALAHTGLMDSGKPDLRVVVVPGSGTGELAGISGALTIRIEGGKHFYELAYSLTTK